jgi:para-nitrobenzyl esterase
MAPASQSRRASRSCRRVARPLAVSAMVRARPSRALGWRSISPARSMPANSRVSDCGLSRSKPASSTASSGPRRRSVASTPSADRLTESPGRSLRRRRPGADNATLFGESAGAEDALALMCAPQARGLFKRAIAESPGGGWAALKAVAEAQPAIDDPDITVDGHLLAETPTSAFAAGRAAAIPLIIGTNDEEGSLLGPDARPEGLFTQLTPADLERLRGLYGTQGGDDSAFARLLLRDGSFAGPARSVAVSVARAGATVYLYRFAYVMSVLQGRRTGAHHGSEIPFVFENWPTSHLSDADQRAARAMHDCWIAFARSGRPDCADAPQWQPLEPLAEARWMFIDAHPGMRPIEGAAALDLLQSRLAAEATH